jgi:hypothetical protein
MSKKQIALVSLFFLVTTPVHADRALNETENAQVRSALSAQGCYEGRFELDDGQYEVEAAKYSDGKTYELKFDSAFQLLEKKLKH